MSQDMEKLQTLKELVKDVSLIQDYFEDPEAVVNNICRLSSEVARIEAVKQILHKVVETKNDFVKEAVKLEDMIKETQDQYNEIFNERKEIIKEVNTAKILVRGLMLQLKEAYSMIYKARIQPELLERIMSETKQILRTCPRCKSEKFGMIEETLDESECPKCKLPFEFQLLYSAV